MTPITSKQFSVNKIDILKGFATAVFTDVIAVIIESIKAGSVSFNWTYIGLVALSAFLGYLLKNFLTPARIVITDPKAVNSVKQGDATVKVIEKKATPKKKNG